MISAVVLVTMAILGILWLVPAAVLLMAGRAVASAAMLALAGVATVTAAVLLATDHESVGRSALGIAWAVALPLALTTYPRAAWREPADFLALAALIGSGLLVTAQPHREEVVSAGVLTSSLVILVHTWWRIERAGAQTRRSLTWLAVAAGGSALVGLVAMFVPSDAALVATAAAFATLGPAMLLGTSERDVVDVRSVVVTVVVAAVAAIGYIAVLTALAAVFEITSGRPPAVAEIAVLGAVSALSLPPLMTALRGVVDELLFGAASDPIEAATHVADRSAGDPLLALRAVRESLSLPYAGLRVRGHLVASSGAPATNIRTIALLVGQESLGELEVGLRPGEPALSDADRRALALVAPLVALTARSASLATDLQDAREQSVIALEEERRRIRRDLHDGLGPRLSGIAFTADAARNSVAHDPAHADALLARLRVETTTAIEEVRGIVYAMRPPALDELGLVQALRQQALALRTADGALITVSVSAADALPTLPAAVEVAAYRIAVEALSNAARHSGGGRATLTLCVTQEALVVEVLDEGRTPAGSADRWVPGVGIAGMRERAAEVGGSLSAGPAGPAGSGGRVRATLPLHLGSGLYDPAGQSSRTWAPPSTTASEAPEIRTHESWGR